MNQLNARADALPEIAMSEYSVRLYDQRLFLVESSKLQNYHGSFEFALNPEIEIEQFGIRLTRHAIFTQLKIEDHDQVLTLKFRNDGQQNKDRHRLKRLFQKHRVPPWQRSTVAQVFLDGQLEGLLL
jgi:tRNA(Ile)-lysidine synthetase-like protein